MAWLNYSVYSVAWIWWIRQMSLLYRYMYILCWGTQMSLVFVAGLPELPNQLNTQHRLWPSHVTMEEQVHHTDQVSRNFCTYSAPNMTSSRVSIVWVRAVPSVSTLPCFKFVPHPVQGVCMSMWAPLQKLIMGVTRSFHCTYIKCIVWLTKHGLCSSDGTIIFFISEVALQSRYVHLHNSTFPLL